jgi:tetratricopeptide (TPR) repeat protein
MRAAAFLGLCLAALCVSACDSESGPRSEALSLLGQPLYSPPIADDARRKMDAELAEARATWTGTADDVEGLIWVGRRTAYLGRFREAIQIFTDGIARHPDDARLYRHRGHRYLTVRELDLAVADLVKAASLIDGKPDQVEPDGQPNARNVPTSTLHSNIWYHLALARYLQRDFAGAADAWTRARAAVANPDNLVAASHWLYLSLRRAGRGAEAAAVLDPIRADLDVIENKSYLSLLLMYRGEKTPEDVLAAAGEGSSAAAVRYGVGAWYLIQGRDADAKALWKQMVDQPDWPSFGHLAAEAELR